MSHRLPPRCGSAVPRRGGTGADPGGPLRAQPPPPPSPRECRRPVRRIAGHRAGHGDRTGHRHRRRRLGDARRAGAGAGAGRSRSGARSAGRGGRRRPARGAVAAGASGLAVRRELVAHRGHRPAGRRRLLLDRLRLRRPRRGRRAHRPRGGAGPGGQLARPARRHATPTRPGPRTATAPTSSAPPSAPTARPPTGGSTGTPSPTRRCRSPSGPSTPTATPPPGTGLAGRRGRAHRPASTTRWSSSGAGAPGASTRSPAPAPTSPAGLTVDRAARSLRRPGAAQRAAGQRHAGGPARRRASADPTGTAFAPRGPDQGAAPGGATSTTSPSAASPRSRRSTSTARTPGRSAATGGQPAPADQTATTGWRTTRRRRWPPATSPTSRSTVDWAALARRQRHPRAAGHRVQQPLVRHRPRPRAGRRADPAGRRRQRQRPNYLGRVQPYAVYVPTATASARRRRSPGSCTRCRSTTTSTARSPRSSCRPSARTAARSARPPRASAPTAGTSTRPSTTSGRCGGSWRWPTRSTRSAP